MPATKEQAGAVLAGFVKSQANIVVQSIPNLSVIANDALDIGRLVQDFKTNTTAWAAFGEYVQTAVLQVLQSVNPSIVLPLITSSDAAGDANSTTQNGSTGNAVEPTQFVQNLIKLHEVLEDVNTVIKGMRSSPLWKRVRSFAQDPGAIEDLRQKVDDVLKLFELKAITQMGLSLDKVAADVEKSLRHTEELNESMKRVAISQNQVTLDRLPYTAGSSWDSSKGCFQNTRQTMLQKIKDWIHPSPGQNSPANAEVMAVAGVAGSGKSTVMHTLGQYCANQGWLGSAFFFDRSVEGRNDMFKLFTTMAVDLSAYDPGLESQIVTTTSRDKSLISAMPMRQFEELVSKPLSTYQGQKPVVIIIDAIDEGIDIREPRASPLIDILRDHVQKLPPTVRFLVTYRTHPTLDEYFRDRPHIRNLSIDTRDEQSNSDVSNFIDHELRELSRRKHLGGNWPSEKDVKELAQRAEGLFQWAAMACGYLAKSPNPPRDLKGLTENSTLSSESPEAKMDGLYKAVLESYDWKDPTFAEGINVVLGTILAAKIPLSASALHSLHRMSSVPIDEILQQISPFITRWNGRDRNRPIHIIHQSLREHLTAVPREGEDEQPPAGTNSSSPNRRFMFEKLRSRELALPCLTIMNEQLSDTTPGAGYIHGTQTYEIPKFPKERISEELRYAVQYWTDHLVDVEGQISASLSVALRAFFTSNLVSWMEVACVYGRYQGLRKVIRWIMANIPDRAGIIKHIVNAERAKSLRMLSQHLTHMDRPEEALNALQDAVDLYQQFESDRQSGIDVDLSRSMRLLASQLTQAGRDNEAITASEMTLTIDRRLVEENPGQYMEQLAASLDTYATVMSRVGRNTESFPHIQESVDLYQKLAEQDPGLYSDDLARALNNLAAHLGRMGRDEEAIPIIRDALSAYRYLVQEWPDIHTPHLANTLSNYSTFLSSVGKHQEALPYAEEAVTLYRQLARDRPATYTQDFASGLSKYAAALSELDRRVEALPIMREATELLRAQYAERPDANIARFASALYNLSSHLNALHQYAEGLEVTIEAVDIYQILNERQHGIHKFSLGVLFSRLHRAYEQLDQEDDAFAAILEAVRYYRETDYNSDTNGNIHTSLAVALSSLSTSYAKIGYEEECINFAKESVDVLRIAVAAEPENIKTRYTLGQSLLCLNGHYLRAARAEESHPCATEAVEIYRELAGILPSVYTDDLAESYGKLCRSLEELNRMDEALAAGIESLCLYRACAEENPLQFNSKVLDSYVLVMRCLIGLDDQETVADMMNEAIQMYRTTLETCPDSLNNRLADLYEKLASNLEARMAAAAAGI